MALDNLSQIARHFSDEAAAWKEVERVRWPDGPACPHCGVVDHAYYLEPKQGARATKKGTVSYRRVWKCGACRKQFSVLVGTIFEDSKIALSKWLLAVHMLCAGKNGVAAYELHRTLGVTPKSAWFMAHRIRYAMVREPLASKLQGAVEADKTYIGGRLRKQNGQTKREAARQRMDNKTPVVTLVELNGEARSEVMQHVTGENLGTVLREHADQAAALMTDSASVYTKPGKEFARHETVDHTAGEYARGDARINTAEGYFSQLKRSIDGTHHHVSERYLPRYLGEFDYRYSTRKVKDGERTEQTIKQAAGKRLTYRQPAGE